MCMYNVYALISKKDGRIYVGFSDNVNRRLKEHNLGKTKSTKGYRPWSVLYVQQVNNRKIAREIEKKLKSGSGKEFLKQLKDNVPVAQLDRATAF